MSALYRTLTGQSQKSHHSDHTVGSQAHPTLTRTTTTDPLTGTLNHLTAPQEQKLEEFKEKLQQGGWWSPDGVNGKPSHDDGTLLRYLRARKFDVQGAIGQFTDTEQWLKEQMVDELYDNFDVEIYERSRQVYPQWTGHRDRRGIPIYVYVIKQLDSKHVNKYQKESQTYKDSLPNHKKLQTPAKLLPLFALYQNLLNFVLPFVSTLERPNPEVPVTNSTNIVDISGVGLTQFWNLKNHMQDASVLATAHYPETLDRIFIIGAPSFFPTVWGWIKRWFDPVTVSKIFILGKNEVKPTLSKFMDPKDFPKRYGGELGWDWGDQPHLDEETRAALERDGNKGWVRGPCLWLDGKRVAVGSESGKPRRPATDIEKMKPVVYAADYTETPVHPDKKLSIVSKTRVSNGTAPAHHAAEEHAAEAKDGATAASILATKSNSEPPAQVGSNPEQPAQVIPQPQSTEPQPEPSTGSTSEAQASQLISSATYAHPPSQPQPGPIPEHTVALTSAIENKLADESVSIIPPTANGHANGHATAPGEGHAEVVVASDLSKGLAIETEKLNMTDDPHQKEGGAQRPGMERFVTAQEV
ncbi:CRAL/TRIO domain containing protein [Cladophialophora carrionii]|uniref:CRAL/TRIO domain containing protein n=1 Tax=Cladophialophora carrionii TaxID=86049 RepID=A0A1C1D262_9EURO|nr:CRAL/TRIO domain containing protein [Cladophialophora carrionii]